MLPNLQLMAHLYAADDQALGLMVQDLAAALQRAQRALIQASRETEWAAFRIGVR